MARYVDSISIKGMGTEVVLAIAYQAFKNLEWEILLSGQDTLIGHTPDTGKSKGQQINCEVNPDFLTVISETVLNDLPNINLINKNNTAIFFEAFEKARLSIDNDQLISNLHAIDDLRNVTQKAIARQKVEFEELDKAMNLSGSNLFATYSIIGINLMVFLAMVLDGAGLFEPDGLVHIRWGSNFTPLTLSGDWWRLITNTFIHFGVIHITMNMYCLYFIATYLEPLLGKVKYLTAYLCTGIFASLVSLWWHNESTNSAGASGAIFGMYGLFLAFLTTSLIPQSIRKSMLKSIGIFVIFNLLYGLKSGVDNAAHIGGLISGSVIGYGYVFAIKNEKKQGKKSNWLIPVIIFLTIGLTAFYLLQNKIDKATRSLVISELTESSYKGYTLYNSKLKAFDNINKSALEAMADTLMPVGKRLDKLNYIVQPLWEQANQLLLSANNLDLSQGDHKKISFLLDYIKFRKMETALLIESNNAKDPNSFQGKLEACRKNADASFLKATKPQ